MDSNQMYPTDDRQQILAFTPEGQVSSVDVGNHAFAWRLPGVHRRRRDGGVALPPHPDPLPAPRGGGPRRDLHARRRDALRPVADRDERRLRRRSSSSRPTRCSRRSGPATGAGGGAFWVVMPLIGVCLGLALASKWVALYAIGGIGLLILVRSALGPAARDPRARRPDRRARPPRAGRPARAAAWATCRSSLIMIALTAAAVVINVLHPVAWSDDEIRFAVAAPAAIGVLIALVAVATKTLESLDRRRRLRHHADPRRRRGRAAVARGLRRVRRGRAGGLRADGRTAAADRPRRAPPAARRRRRTSRGCDPARCSASRSSGWSRACWSCRSRSTSSRTSRGR